MHRVLRTGNGDETGRGVHERTASNSGHRYGGLKYGAMEEYHLLRRYAKYCPWLLIPRLEFWKLCSGPEIHASFEKKTPLCFICIIPGALCSIL